MSLLTYSITSNHSHLLVRAEEIENISALMQKLEGEFAEYYNIRKRRSGAFWGGRYHCTMVDGDRYIWNCMRYIDLNMVRAHAVTHPQEWRWCGFSELVGARQRYRMLDIEEVLRLHGGCSREDFAVNYRRSIEDAIARGRLAREEMWTENIAVGSESFVRTVEEQTQNRVELDIGATASGMWTIREPTTAYS